MGWAASWLPPTFSWLPAWLSESCIVLSLVGKRLLPIYKNLEKDLAPAVTLAEDGLVSQTFADYCGQLEMVQIFIKSVPEDSEGSLQFALLDENQRTLAGRDFPVRGMAAGDYLSLPVNLPSGSRSASYEIRLESMDLSPSDEIRLAITPSDYYPGELLLNGAKKRGDLLIHYLCASP